MSINRPSSSPQPIIPNSQATNLNASNCSAHLRMKGVRCDGRATANERMHQAAANRTEEEGCNNVAQILSTTEGDDLELDALAAGA